jgi:hypothetical protein
LLLLYDVMQAEAAIDEMFPEALPKMQRDALTSFVHDIGASAFRNSDVARYLFEGRVEAAAEALAGYGEGIAERREAESAMLLAGLDDALAASRVARKPALIDLVIKVEHPAEPAGVAEPAVRPRAALPDSIMPPPPPPLLSRQAVARREAESEIARILATVGAMPQDDEAPQFETADEALEVEPVTEAEPVAEPALESVVEPADEALAEAVAQPAAEIESAEAEPIDGLAAAPQTASESADEAELTPAAASGSESDIEPVPAVAGQAERAAFADAPVSAQVIARMSQEIAHVQTEIVVSEPGRAELPAVEYALPAGVSLGYVLTGSMRAGLTRQPEAAAEAFIDPVADETADAAPEAVPEAGPEAVPEADSEAEAAESRIDAHQPEPSDSAGETAETAETAEPAGPAEADETAAEAVPEPEPVDLVPAAAAIVERTLAVGGDHTPPPHPADEPAMSEGAVGDIAGERSRDGARLDASHIAHLDDLAGMPGASAEDGDEDDAFSPRDLVGATDMFVDTKPVKANKEEDGWGFIVTLIAGLVVTGAGILDIYGDWPRVWVQRDPTWGVMAAVAGGFLVVTASWMLWSVLASKRRQKHAN